ncbi:P-loop containing nucleoside triphosphate hydrolase protein [Penicillium verhagenii]|nr:P-loop containing nucleoside triphosphate hydrolase protein [Penicillium verhagenii]
MRMSDFEREGQYSRQTARREFILLSKSLYLLHGKPPPLTPDPLEEVKDNSPSRLEWIRLKATKDAQSSSLDELMQFVGLEDAKAFLIRLWWMLRIAEKQEENVDIYLNIAIVGNPGSGDTVSEKTTLELPDYSDDELRRLLVEKIAQTKWKFHGGPKGKYIWMFIRVVGSARGPGFRNFGHLTDAWNMVLRRQRERIYRAQLQRQRLDFLLITQEDLIGPDPTVVHRQSTAWKKLQAMIGMENVKASIQTLFNRVTQNYHRLQQGEPPLQAPLNRVFLGPPGTGKTTVGKLYAQILADLGLLTKGEVIVKNPSDFIGPHIGQSEDRTKQILEQAEGNVLIIDDAYMLHPGSRSGGSDESDIYRIAVIDTLVAEIDNSPGSNRCVILLGYEEEMQEMFRKSNAGLARRFNLADAIHFTDYTLDQLGGILDSKLKESALKTTEEGRRVALEILERASERPNFGNGGEVDNLLGRAQDSFIARTAAVPLIEGSGDATLAPEDFDLQYNRHLQAATECKARFQDLIGMEEVIHQLQEYQSAVVGMRKRNIDPRPFIPFTFVFRGPPGTGKTSSARKMGQVFYDKCRRRAERAAIRSMER